MHGLTTIFMLTGMHLYPQHKQVLFEGKFHSPLSADSVIFEVHKAFSAGVAVFPVAFRKTAALHNGKFTVLLDSVTEPVYISVTKDDAQEPFLFQYLAVPGDVILMDIGQLGTRFYGRGAEKYNWRFSYDLFINAKINSLPAVTLNEAPEQWFTNNTLLVEYSLKRLSEIEKVCPESTYHILRADIIGKYEGQLCRTVADLNFGLAYGDTLIADRIREAFVRYRFHTDLIENERSYQSLYYALFLYHKVRCGVIYDRLSDHQTKDMPETINENFINGKLKDKIMLTWLFAQYPINQKSMQNTMAQITTEKYRSMLQELTESFSLASGISSFEFRDKENKLVRLTDYKDKVMVLDMWFTGCAGCVRVAKYLREIEKYFQSHDDIVFVSLSIDKDKEKWLRSVMPESGFDSGYHYTHYITDKTVYLNTGSEGADHAFIKRYNPVDRYPALLVIDKKGKLLSSDFPLPVSPVKAGEFISLLENTVK